MCAGLCYIYATGQRPAAKGSIARPHKGLTLYTASGVEASGGGSPRPCSRMYVCTYVLSSSVRRRARDCSASTRASPPWYEHGRPALAPLPGRPSPSCAPSLAPFPPLTSGVLAFATALHQSFLMSRAKHAHLGPRWPVLFPYRAAGHWRRDLNCSPTAMAAVHRCGCSGGGGDGSAGSTITAVVPPPPLVPVDREERLGHGGFARLPSSPSRLKAGQARLERAPCVASRRHHMDKM